MTNQIIYESDLYQPIKQYLVNQGYKVNGEVKDCDITATKDDDLLIIEMKKNLNLTVLVQATKRQRTNVSVYIAILYPKGGINNKKWRNYIHLLKRLELGLITISFKKATPSINIVFHPMSFNRKTNNKMKKSIIKEINNRHGDYNIGGVSKTKLVTAYKENAIFIGCVLEKFGDMKPSHIKKYGTCENTGSILYKNYYGWFERIDTGIYRISSVGLKAIKNYKELYQYYTNTL